MASSFWGKGQVNRKLHVLMICNERPSKCRQRVYPIAKSLVERGHDVTLMMIAERRRLGVVEGYWDGVWTVESPDLLWGRLRSGWDPWNTLNRALYLRADRRPYDLIFCSETRPATIHPALLHKRRHNLPLITDWMDWWGRGGIIDEFRPDWYRVLFGRIETYYEEAFRARAQGLTVISAALAKRAVGLGVQPERILHLPNGTHPEHFNVPDSAACRRKVDLDLDGPIIGYASQDTHFDLAPMIEVLARVVRRFPRARLLVTGKAPKQIAKLARASGVRRNLILTGFLPYEEFPWYLGCADLFVMPFPETVYNIGRWPSKVGAYMSVGRPTVSNPTGDVTGLFEKHNIGVLARWDPEDFCRQIIFLLEHPDVAQQLGENARRAAVTEYDWKVLIRKLESFFYKILEMA